eukprot:CAMPEP_0170627668 /NCGR_PEP_ID=MMETSP0224-20130122/32118_1 /TAXON_ID=285029 /ORGANISM="Togula jolla, Strain CCCM 725" /LENGTH=194 /DNA_ID=CAMNT_0010954731 /DNA_START=561 /DNA_END=1145 /DNA_ORIENTATION=-
MGLQALLTGDATLPCLAPPHVLRHALGKLIREDLQHRGHSHGTVGASHIHLALVMHPEAAIRVLHPQQELVGLTTVHDGVGHLTARDHQGRDCRVGGGQVGELAWAPTKAAARVLALRKEGGCLGHPHALGVGAEHVQRVRDPKDEPGPRGIEACEVGRKTEESSLMPFVSSVGRSPDARNDLKQATTSRSAFC